MEEGKGEGIAAVWRKHDGAAGVARSASHAHCLGVDNDFGVTLAWLWPPSGMCSRSTPTWLGRDYRTAVRLRALVSSKPTRGPAAAGIRLGFGLGSVGSLISLRCARSRRWVRGHSGGLRRLATMTNQRFVWRRSQALSLLGRSLAANLHQAACMRYFCLLPRYGQDLLG